jgi:hypothetical protein
LAIFPDGQHNTTWLSRDYTDQIKKFLAEVSGLIQSQFIELTTHLYIDSAPAQVNQLRQVRIE